MNIEQYLIYNTQAYPVLSALLFIPLLGAFLVMLIPGADKKSGAYVKCTGLCITLLNLILAVPLFAGFDTGTASYQFVEFTTWIPSLKLNYIIGVDGISVLLVLLTILVMPLSILCSWAFIKERPKEFVVVMLIMESSMVGVFVSMNLVLFFIFWESILLPMYLLISLWGGDNKDYASIKYFLYTFIGSVFMGVSIVSLYIKTGTFFIPEIMTFQFRFDYQVLIFMAFALAFTVKLSLYPFHTWLSAAHVEAPVAGNIVLSCILLQMGGYGFLRFCIPMTPQATLYFMPFFITLSLVSMIAGGYLALGQTDIKRLIAYSSVGHMGLVTLGIFLCNHAGIAGALMHMVNHGITTGALFICVGILYERTCSREIHMNSALGSTMPVFLIFFTIFSFSSFGFPGTNSFVSEFFVLLGAFRKHWLIGSFAIFGVVLTAIYMLRLLQRTIWADSVNPEVVDVKRIKILKDLTVRETVTLSILMFFIFWIGLNPNSVLTIMDESVKHLLDQYNSGLLHGVPADGYHTLLDNSVFWTKDFFSF